MAKEKVDNKLNVVIGTKAQIEGDTSIPENSIIVVTDEVIRADEIVYSVEKNVKEAIEDLEDEKVDKVTNTTPNAQVYGKDTSGNQAMYNLAIGLNIAGAIVLRDAEGRSSISTPTTDNHITNKKYVDDAILYSKEIFIATFGTTTFAEITQALADGKLPIAISGTYYYTFVNTPAGNQTYYFQSMWLGNLKHVFVTDSDVWANRDISLEPSSNKVQTISASSTTTQFPSAKAVYDLVDEKQDKLVAGDGISIVGNTISASGGGGGGALYAVNILKPEQFEGTDKHAYYSIDDGNTWIELFADMHEVITINASQIKLKVSTTVRPLSILQCRLLANYRSNSSYDYKAGVNVSGRAGEQIDSNYVLTAEEQPYVLDFFCDGDD